MIFHNCRTYLVLIDFKSNFVFSPRIMILSQSTWKDNQNIKLELCHNFPISWDTHRCVVWSWWGWVLGTEVQEENLKDRDIIMGHQRRTLIKWDTPWHSNWTVERGLPASQRWWSLGLLALSRNNPCNASDFCCLFVHISVQMSMYVEFNPWNTFYIFHSMIFSTLVISMHQCFCNYLDPVRQLPSPLTTDTLLVSILGTAIGWKISWESWDSKHFNTCKKAVDIQQTKARAERTWKSGFWSQFARVLSTNYINAEGCLLFLINP